MIEDIDVADSERTRADGRTLWVGPGRLVAMATGAVLGLALVFGVSSSGSRSVGPPAPTATVVAGVRLVPPGPSLRGACVRAAKVGGFAVPCPRLIFENPGAPGADCPDEDRPYAGGKDCLEDSAAGNSSLPSHRDAFTYVENLTVPDALHLFVVGVKADSRLAPFRAGCVGQERAEPGPALDGLPTEWVECPSGNAMNSGHVMLRWHRGDVIYVVSLHYQTQRNRELEVVLARAIEYVAPP